MWGGVWGGGMGYEVCGVGWGGVWGGVLGLTQGEQRKRGQRG